MTANRSINKNSTILIALAFAACAHAATTDISTEPLNTYSAPSSTDVKPNVLFVLDDSGSMDWDFMPDWACASFSLQNPACSSTGQNPSSARSEFLFRNSSYNGIYYNPAVTYKPPVAVDSNGAINTTTYPSMTGMSTATGANTSYSLPNWRAVKDDAYGIQSTSTSNLMSDPNNPPYFFTTVAGEYCTAANLRTCVTASGPSTSYPFPAKLRWCDSNLSNCRATFSSTYSYARAPSPSVATITVSGSTSTNTSVSGITVNGQQIMAGATTSSSTYSTVAQRIVDQINLCTISTSGNCTVRGYHASFSGSVVTIIAPTTITYPLNINSSGSMTLTATSFSKGSVEGTNLPTVITPDINSYPKAGTRTDCAGASCTYAEEITNYANWWTYYRTRMQMMKTAASNAFSTIDTATDITNNISRFRLGYISINNNTSSDFLNLGEFKGAQKYNWYSKLINANPGNSTPLRAALSKAGRLYAGKLNGSTLNGSAVTDPLQYSCQQNYTILSTDGFWNESSGYYKMDGSTNVGNQDAGLPPPYYDGGSGQVQTKTSTLQSQSVTQQSQTSTSSLQQQTTQLQTRTSQLQTRTSSNYGSTWTAWSDVSSCSLDTSGSSRRDCRYTSWSSWTGTNSCTAAPQDTSNPYSVGLARECQTVIVSPYTNVSSCTATSIDNSGFQTTCQYSAWTPYTNTGSCTALAQSTSSPYTVGTATRCNTVTTLGAWTNATSCTASSTQNCQYTGWTAWSNASSCTVVPQSTGPTYTVGTARDCQTLNSGGTSNTLADVAAYYYNTDLRNPDATKGTGTCTGPVIPPATTPTDLCADNVPKNGRDVAETQHMTTFTLGLGAQGQMVYQGSDYWNEKSGDFFDVLNGNTVVASSGNCSWQSSGTCVWPTPASNSNANIDDLWHAAVNGHGTYFSATDPLSLASSLTSTLATIINTPRPGTAAAAASSNPNVSASDNYVFSSSYKSVEWYGELIRQKINDDDGTLTAQNWSAMKLLDCATTPWTASTNYVAGDVFRQGTTCYEVTADYTSGATYDSSSSGNDISKTKVINADESASIKTPVVAPTSRTIYTKGTSGLISFNWTTLVDAGLSSYFTKPAIAYVSGSTGLTQFCASGGGCLSATLQDNNTIATGGAAGEALVNFLRGDRSNENTYFRKRVHVLGDIVSAEARYVKVPMFNYTDAGYSDFKTLKKDRAGVVYAAANDGMLHAFDAENGKELWAYIPGMVLPNIYKLADKNYSTQHQYFVDGTPEVGDICPTAPATDCAAGDWKTILVGGLNRGGKGYYALDITDPANPRLLWEYTDSNLGYSYGNPKITKLKNGTWVVMFGSGYNNADGVGRLYVLNANTGTKIANSSISTGIGSPGSPSGLARISAHVVQPMTDNTTVAVYGGDVFGNLWRFDVNGDIGADGYDAQLLVSLKDATGAAQPITVKPLEITINGKPVVYVGTGRYLGTSDVGSSQGQSFYAIKDNLDATTYANPRTTPTFVRQTVSSGPCPSGSSICSSGETVRLGTSNPVDWTTKNGWYLDFLTSGERSVTDPSLALGTLLFTTITPNGSSASACGDPTNTSASFAYALDYLTGSAVSGANGAIGVNVGSGLVTRPVMIEQSNGTVRALIRTSGGANTSGTDLGGTIVITPPIKQSSGGSTKRVSWRELTNK